MIYRITLQYKFKRTTLRNTSTDKLNHGILFSSSVVYNYPRLINLGQRIESKIPDKMQQKHISISNDAKNNQNAEKSIIRVIIEEFQQDNQ